MAPAYYVVSILQSPAAHSQIAKALPIGKGRQISCMASCWCRFPCLATCPLPYTIVNFFLYVASLIITRVKECLTGPDIQSSIGRYCGRATFTLEIETLVPFNKNRIWSCTAVEDPNCFRRPSPPEDRLDTSLGIGDHLSHLWHKSARYAYEISCVHRRNRHSVMGGSPALGGPHIRLRRRKGVQDSKKAESSWAAIGRNQRTPRHERHRSQKDSVIRNRLKL